MLSAASQVGKSFSIATVGDDTVDLFFHHFPFFSNFPFLIGKLIINLKWCIILWKMDDGKKIKKINKNQKLKIWKIKNKKLKIWNGKCTVNEKLKLKIFFFF